MAGEEPPPGAGIGEGRGQRRAGPAAAAGQGRGVGEAVVRRPEHGRIVAGGARGQRRENPPPGEPMEAPHVLHIRGERDQRPGPGLGPVAAPDLRSISAVQHLEIDRVAERFQGVDVRALTFGIGRRGARGEGQIGQAAGTGRRAVGRPEILSIRSRSEEEVGGGGHQEGRGITLLDRGEQEGAGRGSIGRPEPRHRAAGRRLMLGHEVEPPSPEGEAPRIIEGVAVGGAHEHGAGGGPIAPPELV